MDKVMMLGILGWYSLEDVRKKKITVHFLPLLGIAGIVLRFIMERDIMQDMLGGVLTGVAVLGLSVASKGGIGKGDGFLLIVTGIYLGAEYNLSFFLLGLLYAAVWSLGAIILKKRSRKWEIPFVPFLMAAYLTMMAGGGL